MCCRMVAYHRPCGHFHRWFGRCFWAKFLNLDCQVPTLPIQQYEESFLCSVCAKALREEADGEVGRFGGP